jgi:phage terminase large subunit-like protein
MESLRVRVAGSMEQIRETDPAMIREWDLAIAKENAKDSQLR